MLNIKTYLVYFELSARMMVKGGCCFFPRCIFDGVLEVIYTVGTALAFKNTFSILLNLILNYSSSLSMKFFSREWTLQITTFMGWMDFAAKSRHFICTYLTHKIIVRPFFVFWNICMWCPDWVEFVHPAQNTYLPFQLRR